jgi:hypothetical protein
MAPKSGYWFSDQVMRQSNKVERPDQSRFVAKSFHMTETH